MNLELKKTELRDANALTKIINEKEVWKQLEGYPYPCPTSRIKKEIRKGLNDWKKKKAYPFTIFIDTDIAGQVILENPDKHKTHYEIGYFVSKDYWNKGVSTSAVKRITEFGFKSLKLERVWGDNDSDNPASGKVMQKAGFKLEGRLRKHRYKNKKFVDVLIWGKLR